MSIQHVEKEQQTEKKEVQRVLAKDGETTVRPNKEKETGQGAKKGPIRNSKDGKWLFTQFEDVGINDDSGFEDESAD